VTLTITAGSELGQFVSPEGVPSGSSVTRLASEIPYTEFIADAGSSAGGVVTVQASSKGIIGTATFRVVPFLGKTLKLEAVPPIIPFGQNGGFGVQVLDEAGEPVLIPDNMTLKYEILEGAQWGVLFDYYTWQTGTVVEGAPWGIDFFTADTAAYEDKRVVVRVSSSSVGLTPDTAEILILPGLLKVSVTPTTLQYGQSAEIVAEGLYQDGELVMLDPSVLYSYEIVQAADAGYLVVGTDITRRDLIPDVGPTARFVAEEEVPQPTSVQVIIKVTAKQEVHPRKVDSVGTRPVSPPVVAPFLKKRMARTQEFIEDIGVARVVVNKSVCARVMFVPPELAPGDTAALRFAKEDGADFPADQLFDVMIVSGDDAGTLLSASGSGPLLTGTLAPVSYVAPGEIEGDSLIVQVVALASGTGAAVAPLAHAEQVPLFKKGPGPTAMQALGKRAKDSVKVALGNLLAESICEPGQAVVVQQIAFPSCGEIPLPKISFSKGEDDNQYGCEIKNPLEPPFSYCTIDEASLVVKVRVCFDAFLKSPRCEPYILSAEGKYGVCATNVDLYNKKLLRIRDPVSPEDACVIKADLEYRFDSIEQNHGRSFPWYQTWVTEAELLIHEEAHWPQLQEYLRKALENESNRQSKTLLSREEGARLATNEQARQEIANRAKKNILDEIDKKVEKNHDDDEVDPRLMQAKTIQFLIEQFAKSCH
jgi:hypothetical protein